MNSSNNRSNWCSRLFLKTKGKIKKSMSIVKEQILPYVLLVDNGNELILS